MAGPDSVRRRRRILLIVTAASITAWQLPTIDVLGVIRPEAAWTNVIQIAGFALTVAAAIALAALWRPRDAAVRAQMDVEDSRAKWRAALASGYWAVVVAAATLYVLSLFLAVTAAEAAQIMLATAAVTPLLRYARLDWPRGASAAATSAPEG